MKYAINTPVFFQEHAPRIKSKVIQPPITINAIAACVTVIVPAVDVVGFIIIAAIPKPNNPNPTNPNPNPNPAAAPSTNKTNVKKKPAEVERNYEIRPKLIMKFTKEKVYDVIKNVLDQKMQSMKGKYNHEDAMQLNKEICDEVKLQLKEDKMNFKRYKILVHCIIGEKKGQGIKIGCRCMWDMTCDSVVSASWESEYTYAFCIAYGVYFY